MTNFLTFDIEEWYRVNYRNCDAPTSGRDTRLVYLVHRILDICEEHKSRCTFFVLGTVAETHPSLVRLIHEAGHEVASHGYSHRSLLTMTEDEFRADTSRGLAILQSTIGAPVSGYRAPSFSVSEANREWYYRVLEECGFGYSSSVFPGKTFLYGIPGSPEQPHRVMSGTRETRLVEFPISRMQLLTSSIPLYMRLFPARFLNRVIQDRNQRGESVMLYLHPREIDPEQHRLKLPRLQAAIHYWGIEGCDAKLCRLLALRPPLSRLCDTAASIAGTPRHLQPQPAETLELVNVV